MVGRRGAHYSLILRSPHWRAESLNKTLTIQVEGSESTFYFYQEETQQEGVWQETETSNETCCSDTEHFSRMSHSGLPLHHG
jgi:hypothetical protein